MSAHQLSDPVGIRFRMVSGHRVPGVGSGIRPEAPLAPPASRRSIEGIGPYGPVEPQIARAHGRSPTFHPMPLLMACIERQLAIGI